MTKVQERGEAEFGSSDFTCETLWFSNAIRDEFWTILFIVMQNDKSFKANDLFKILFCLLVQNLFSKPKFNIYSILVIFKINFFMD